MPNIIVTLNGAEFPLDVRRIEVDERLSSCFELRIEGLSRDPNLPLRSAIGGAATVTMAWARGPDEVGATCWSGLCTRLALVRTERDGASSYRMSIGPELCKLDKRSNYRLFQHLSVPEIAATLLRDHALPPAVFRIDEESHEAFELRVQYGESDYAFLCRLFEEDGLTFFFERVDGKTVFVVTDAPDDPSGGPTRALRAVDELGPGNAEPCAGSVHVEHSLCAGSAAFVDYDFRNPTLAINGRASEPRGLATLERRAYLPGVALVDAGGPGSTTSDDESTARYLGRAAAKRAEFVAAGEGHAAESVRFRTRALDLAPGTVFTITDHPHSELGTGPLLARGFELRALHDGEWIADCDAVFADRRYVPPVRTPKPAAHGVVTATVIGRSGQHIYTDEFGRVRVQFPWDSEGSGSCWLRVSQGWAGGAYGMMALPRGGQEVLVAFTGGNPDQPIVVGRVYNATQAVPYPLPEHKTRSTWRSSSSPGGDGSNELMFEDEAGGERILVHAQRDLAEVVEHDESIAIGRNRTTEVRGDESEHVVGDRSETIDGFRTESTAAARTVRTGGHHRLDVGASYTRRVDADDVKTVRGRMQLEVEEDCHVSVNGEGRARYGSDLHVHVGGERREKVAGSASSIVGDDWHAKVGGLWALAAGDEIHLKAQQNLVIECDTDLTLSGPGGFLRIDASGVVIQGKVVKINSGGSAGSGSGAAPEDPKAPDAIEDDASDEGEEKEKEKEREPAAPPRGPAPPPKGA